MNHEPKMQDNYDLTGASQGALHSIKPHETDIILRLDSEVVEWFAKKVEQAGSGDYAALINQALHEFITYHDQNKLENLIRSIVREEMKTSQKKSKTHQESRISSV